ncbi:hypothetical protein D3C87_1730010 [compost metagenome]
MPAPIPPQIAVLRIIRDICEAVKQQTRGTKLDARGFLEPVGRTDRHREAEDRPGGILGKLGLRFPKRIAQELAHGERGAEAVDDGLGATNDGETVQATGRLQGRRLPCWAPGPS